MPQLEFGDFVPQLVWLVISFAGLYLMMTKVALPRIGEVIDARQERIQRDIDEAERMKRETESALAKYEQALAEARGRAHVIAEETRDKLNAEVAGERAEVDARIAEKTAEAEARIRSAKADALDKVSEVARATAGAIVSELIGATVTDGQLSEALGETLGRD